MDAGRLFSSTGAVHTPSMLRLFPALDTLKYDCVIRAQRNYSGQSTHCISLSPGETVVPNEGQKENDADADCGEGREYPI